MTLRKKSYTIDWRANYQRFARTFQRQKYELIVQPVIVTTCGCIQQPHVHAVTLVYVYGFQNHYPYHHKHTVEYDCADVGKAIKAIDDFHGQGVVDIAMLSRL